MRATAIGAIAAAAVLMGVAGPAPAQPGPAPRQEPLGPPSGADVERICAEAHQRHIAQMLRQRERRQTAPVLASAFASL